MPFFKSLGRDSAVRDILAINRDAGKALVHYHLAVLRQPSPLSVGERELIADVRKAHGRHRRRAGAGQAEAHPALRAQADARS